MLRRSIAVAGVLTLAGCTGRADTASVPAGDGVTSIPTVTLAPTTAHDASPSTTRPTTTTSTTTTTTSSTSTTSTTTSSTTTSSTSTTVPPPRQLTMAFTGDILPHSPLWRAAARYAADAGRPGHDFAPMFAPLVPLLGSVDLAVCQLETPIAPEGQEFSTHPRYAVPVEIAAAIASAGYDRCSTASNHAIDQGPAGIERTITALEAQGISQSGMARTPEEILPKVFVVNDVIVSHLSYTWSYNGLTLPEAEAWRSALIDPDRIIGDARMARELGAEIIVVSLHWGAEGRTEPTPYQRQVADVVTADGFVDLIVGHHAHVVQPIEQVNGTWVLYGTGNILSNLPTSASFPDAAQDAAVFVVEMSIDSTGAVTVGRPVAHPTWVDKDARWTVRMVFDELDRTDLSAGQRGRLQRSLERTLSVLGEYVPFSP